MQKCSKLLTLLLIPSLVGAQEIAPKVIFDNDTRRPIEQTPTSVRQRAHAVGLMFSPVYLEQRADGLFDFDFVTHEENASVCPNTRFAQLPTAAINCTGFLVAPDLVVTAGHCMVNTGVAQDEVTAFCRDFHWYFNYQVPRTQTGPKLKGIDPNDIYQCKNVLVARHETTMSGVGVIDTFGHDYALIQLDRPVQNVRPLKLSPSRIRTGTMVNMIGHPDGLPKVWSPLGRVQEVHSPLYFEATLDSFGGNSGSPVMNDLGEVLGVLVRGPDDYVWNERRGCYEAQVCRTHSRECSSLVEIRRPHVNFLFEILKYLP